MFLISDSDNLHAFCAKAAESSYVTVDTEFIREKTYWPQLCLVQLAIENTAVAIDALEENLDLTPLINLLENRNVLKVFHSARQDIEIFFEISGQIPSPLFDTQIAAMACGYGDSVGYERLVRDYTKHNIDKTIRFTDWSKRPLSPKQIDYALGDVTFLRKIYEKLSENLNETGRTPWLKEELETLTNPRTYSVKPEEVWKRLKARSRKPKSLAALRALASWRETKAQEFNVPRNRVIKDGSIIEIAAQHPNNIEELMQLRALKLDKLKRDWANQIIEILYHIDCMDPSNYPSPPDKPRKPLETGPVTDLLKLLLKFVCDKHNVAQKLVATSSDIEAIIVDDQANVPALNGWRNDLFGKHALRLKHGKIALKGNGQKIELVELGSKVT